MATGPAICWRIDSVLGPHRHPEVMQGLKGCKIHVEEVGVSTAGARYGTVKYL